MVSTIRLGQWGHYALKPEKGGFRLGFLRLNFGQTKQMFGIGKICRFFSPRAVKKNVVFRVFVLSDWNGQNLSCLMKCVGAKCTKRCCRVQQRSAQRCGFVFEVLVRGSLLTPHSSLLTCSCSRYAL